MGKNSKADSPIWQEFELIQDFMPVQVIYKFRKVLIKNMQAMLRTWQDMGFISTQGQVTPKWIVWSGGNLNSSKISWLSWLPASLTMIRSKVKALCWQHFLHYKCMGTKRIVRSGLISNLSETLYLSSLPASLRKIQSKMNALLCWHHFLLVTMETRVLSQSAPETLCSFSHTPIMLHIKFEQDWPTGLRDMQVWKCGRRRSDDGPLLYYKLTFGSGELRS